MSQRRGVAFIECARTPAIPHYIGFNIHKEGTLMVTSVLKTYKGSLRLRSERLTVAVLSVFRPSVFRVISDVVE